MKNLLNCMFKLNWKFTKPSPNPWSGSLNNNQIQQFYLSYQPSLKNLPMPPPKILPILPILSQFNQFSQFFFLSILSTFSEPFINKFSIARVPTWTTQFKSTILLNHLKSKYLVRYLVHRYLEMLGLHILKSIWNIK